MQDLGMRTVMGGKRERTDHNGDGKREQEKSETSEAVREESACHCAALSQATDQIEV